MDLNGKHILITGASSGIGRQIAIDVSKLGAHVTITGRNSDELKNTYNQSTYTKTDCRFVFYDLKLTKIYKKCHQFFSDNSHFVPYYALSGL